MHVFFGSSQWKTPVKSQSYTQRAFTIALAFSWTLIMLALNSYSAKNINDTCRKFAKVNEMFRQGDQICHFGWKVWRTDFYPACCTRPEEQNKVRPKILRTASPIQVKPSIQCWSAMVMKVRWGGQYDSFLFCCFFFIFRNVWEANGENKACSLASAKQEKLIKWGPKLSNTFNGSRV